MSVVDSADAETFKLPAGLDPAEGSMACMPAVGYHGAAEVMPVAKGEWVVVIGLGLIGQFSAQTAHLRQAKVIAIDPIESRRKLAADFAQAIVIDPKAVDPAKVIKEHCPNGADVVIDASANADAVNASFHWIKQQGRYCFQAYYPDKTPLDLLWPHAKELLMFNPCNITPEGLRQCANNLANGSMTIKPMITHNVPAERAPEMYDMLLKRPKEALGVVLDWRKT
jgi:threonine dehydrogenase-like Zn-dependent dehydrogenase